VHQRAVIILHGCCFACPTNFTINLYKDFPKENFELRSSRRTKKSITFSTYPSTGIRMNGDKRVTTQITEYGSPCLNRKAYDSKSVQLRLRVGKNNEEITRY